MSITRDQKDTSQTKWWFFKGLHSLSNQYPETFSTDIISFSQDTEEYLQSGLIAADPCATTGEGFTQPPITLWCVKKMLITVWWSHTSVCSPQSRADTWSAQSLSDLFNVSSGWILPRYSQRKWIICSIVSKLSEELELTSRVIAANIQGCNTDYQNVNFPKNSQFLAWPLHLSNKCKSS